MLGTFWPFVTTPDMRLRSATAGIRRVALSRPAMTLAELITAQPGAAVQITAVADRAGAAPERYAATIVGLTQRSAAEIASQTRHAEEGVLPRIGDVVLLRTAEGVKALPMARVQDVTVAEITERPFVDHQ